jgi:pentatricopeptide repeat protein
MHIHLIEHQYPNHDYQCSLCDQCSFDDASQLYHHMVQHGSKARLHPCRECDVYFMFSMHLINHQYSHKDEMVLLKTNGNSTRSKFSIKSKSISNEDNRQLNEDDDSLCKSIVTRSSTKGTCRSVIVS